MYLDPSMYMWSDYTILIVEDDVSSTFYLKEVLKDTKINIVHASNGQEAVNYCKNQTLVHLILMDIKMPVMDGIEATRTIKHFYPDIPIIAQTANTIYETRISCMEAGCDDFITKPIDSAELLHMISLYLK